MKTDGHRPVNIIW